MRVIHPSFPLQISSRFPELGTCRVVLGTHRVVLSTQLCLPAAKPKEHMGSLAKSSAFLQ